MVKNKGREALRKRLNDIYSGATGGDFRLDEVFVGPGELARIVPAVRDVFGFGDTHEYLSSISNLDEYEDPERLAEFLYRHGIRATGRNRNG